MSSDVQHEELKKRINQLEVELYSAKMPFLNEAMKTFNLKLPSPCACINCVFDGRINHDHKSSNGRGTFQCTFQPEWETMLSRLGITVHTDDANGFAAGTIDKKFCDVPQHLWNHLRSSQQVID